MLVQACLGLEIDAVAGILTLNNAQLPQFLVDVK